MGVHECLNASIQKSDLDLRRTLYQEIVLAGGTTQLKDFPSRLLVEMRRLAPRDMKIKIKVPPECKLTTWIGGSILAALETFQKMWVSHQEYMEKGGNVFSQKSF